MFGLGLVIQGCKLILHFAERYFNERRANYSTEEVALLDALFAAARAIEVALTPDIIL